MKNKFRLWLNIVTICLCVCAIAIGVYSATTATLNVGGKIAFTAHGCTGTVSGTIVGHAEGSTDAEKENGYPTTEAVDLNGGTAVAFGDANGLPLGNQYFSDMASADGSVEDITITLTITNTSAFAITAYIDDENTTLPTNVVTNNDTTPSVKIEKGNTGTLTIGLTLQKAGSNGSYAYVNMSLSTLNIQLGFDKYVDPTYTITPAGGLTVGESTSAYSYLTTTMGKDSEGNDIRWYAIAKSTDGGANFTSIAKTNTTEVASGTYIFISEYILPIQNTTLGSSGRIAFTHKNNPNYAEAYGVNYNGSTIQQYLNGHGANTFAKEYNISDSSVYANISAVDLAGESCDDYRDSTTYTTQDTDNQKLWLLSYGEFNKYFGEGDSSGLGYFNGSADYWWLRSPYEVYSGFAVACCVDSKGGDLSGYDVYYDYYCGVRAAFEITIS
ncbi:MAG: hypothetical protein IJ318_03115 [Clostridia bacterium]|nr:hypothetical protein [Clostridia bacterium]